MGKDPGGAIIAMKAKDQRGNHSPSRGGGHGGGSPRGRTSPPLSRWRQSASGRGIIAVVIVYINITTIITILISFMRSTLCTPL